MQDELIGASWENKPSVTPQWLGGSMPNTPQQSVAPQAPSTTKPSATTGGGGSGLGFPSGENAIVDPTAWTNAINQWRTKAESDNKLIKAKNAIFKNMYDQPLTDDEKAALTPALKVAMQSGDRNMLDAAISGINDQIKGYNNTIDTNLAAYTAAVTETNNLKQNISGHVATMLQAGTDPNSIASYLTGASGGMIKPEDYGLVGSINIPQGTLAATNNNPGNLRYVGQIGARPGAGGFAAFDTPEAGYEALQNQISIDAGRGLTLAQFISKYAPPSENNTSLYIQQAMQALGVSQDTPLSQIDLSRLAQFMAQKESGTTMNYSNAGGGGGTIDTVADAIIAGTQAPPSTGSRPTAYMLQLQSALAKKGFNLLQAQEDWMATTKNITALNSSQQLRLRQAISFSADSLDIIEQLNQAWQGTGLPVLNKANLIAASQGANNQPIEPPVTINIPNPDGSSETTTIHDTQTLATLFNAQINDLTSELGTVYKGGNTSTDESLKLAAGNLSADWSQSTLESAVQLAKTNLQIRKNSIQNSSSMGTGMNPYSQGQGSASSNNDPLGIF